MELKSLFLIRVGKTPSIKAFILQGFSSKIEISCKYFITFLCFSTLLSDFFDFFSLDYLLMLKPLNSL